MTRAPSPKESDSGSDGQCENAFVWETAWHRYLNWVERTRQRAEQPPGTRSVVPAIEANRTVAAVAGALALATVIAVVLTTRHPATALAEASAGAVVSGFLVVQVNRRSPIAKATPTFTLRSDLPPVVPIWRVVAPLAVLYALSNFLIGAITAAHSGGFAFGVLGITFAGSVQNLDSARRSAHKERSYRGILWEPANPRAKAIGYLYIVPNDDLPFASSSRG